MNKQNSYSKLNVLPKIGFVLFSFGPIFIFTMNIFSFEFSVLLANLIMWISIITPGIGAVLCLISAFKWRELSDNSKGYSIIIFVMCNPVFYFLYFVFCQLIRGTLAGFSLM